MSPIEDLLKKEILSQEDQEVRYKAVEMYGSWFMPIQGFIKNVLFPIHNESSIKAFSKLLNDYGLIVYDDETPVSSKELLEKLEHRKTECLIDADGLAFWKPALNKERNYVVYIDDVARSYCLAGNNTFDWYNGFFYEKGVYSISIPEEIKAEIKKTSTANNQDGIKTDGETELKTKPRKKLKPLKRYRTESLQLIYTIAKAHNVKYEDDLTGSNAWGLIVSGKFTSDLIKTKPKNNHDVLVLNDGETLPQTEFIRKYRERFE